MQIVSVLKGMLDVPALNYVISLGIYATSFVRDYQAIRQAAGRHEIPCEIGW